MSGTRYIKDRYVLCGQILIIGPTERYIEVKTKYICFIPTLHLSIMDVVWMWLLLLRCLMLDRLIKQNKPLLNSLLFMTLNLPIASIRTLFSHFSHKYSFWPRTNSLPPNIINMILISNFKAAVNYCLCLSSSFMNYYLFHHYYSAIIYYFSCTMFIHFYFCTLHWNLVDVLMGFCT